MSQLPEPFRQMLGEDRELKDDCVDEVLAEIISAQLMFEVPGRPGDVFAARNPTPEESNRARIVAARRLREAKAKGLPDRDTLIGKGAVPESEILERDRLMTMIQAQLEARTKSTDSKYRDELSAEVRRIQIRVNELTQRHEEVLQHTAQHRAREARTQFLTSVCTVEGPALDQPVWGSFEEFRACRDLELLAAAHVATARALHGLPGEILRAAARHEEWKLTWKAAKESGSPPFLGPATDWTVNQRQIVYWSDFYDAVLQHPDAPEVKALADDEALQVWLAEQQARAKELKDKRRGAQGGAHGKRPTYIDGQGRRREMKEVGRQKISVGTPYRVRPRGGSG